MREMGWVMPQILAALYDDNKNDLAKVLLR